MDLTGDGRDELSMWFADRVLAWGPNMKDL
jgi:hypothetical protein